MLPSCLIIRTPLNTNMWRRRFALLRRKLGLKVTEYRYYKPLLLPKLYTYMGFYFCFCQALPPRQQDLRSDLTEWRRRMILYSTALIRLFCACSLSEPSWNAFVVLNKWNTFPAIRLIQLKTLRPKIKIFPSPLTSRLSYLGRYGNCCWIDLLVDYCKCSFRNISTDLLKSRTVKNLIWRRSSKVSRTSLHAAVVHWEIAVPPR